MSRRQRIIWINLGALTALLASAIAALVLMNGRFGAARWAKSLRTAAPIERMKAAAALGELGPNGAPALPALLDVLRDPDDISAEACAKALVQIDAQRAYDFATALIDRCERRETEITPAVADVFAGLGPVAWHAIPLLESALPTRSERGRSLIPALIDMGDYGPAVVAAIIEDSSNPVYSYRKWDAMLAFDRLGERARPLMPHLERLSAEGNYAVSFQAKMVLGNLKREPAYALGGLHGFSATDRSYQEYALDKLAKLGPTAADAIPEVVTELRSPSTIVRFLATWTLAHIGSPARTALPQLRAMGSDSSSLVRDGAAQAIRTLEAAP